MHPPVGHEGVREILAKFDRSFILSGPAGVGRRGVVAEWMGVHHLVESPTPDPHSVTVLDSDDVRDWNPLLDSLERGRRIVVLTTGRLPLPVRSRMVAYKLGYLTPAQVSEVLSRDFPQLHPRPIIARLCRGSLSGLDQVILVAKTFETFDRCLSERICPNFRQIDPMAAYQLLRLACASALGRTPELPFSDTALSRVTSRAAHLVVSSPLPQTVHSARNAVSLFFGGLR